MKLQKKREGKEREHCGRKTRGLQPACEGEERLGEVDMPPKLTEKGWDKSVTSLGIDMKTWQGATQ